MCGIAGYIGQHPPGQGAIQTALEKMQNRGPDHSNHLSIDTPKGAVRLLHTRLSIIDLDPRSNQPFVSNGCTVAFNGEIYNYLELRGELEKLGHRFSTDSDTEVLVEAYRAWGANCTDRFEGMWAFALWDDAEQRLFMSRDRFGEKPLYLYHGDQGIYFASEVKALKALAGRNFSANRDHLLRYVVNGHKSLYKTNETWHDDVSEFPIAHSTFVHVNRTNEVRFERYWTPRHNERPMSLEEAIEGTRERLIRSVQLRMRSDVPLAFCLSGGVDSAAMVSIAAKCFNVQAQTFSIIDTDVRYNEEDNITATIQDTGCLSTKVVLDPGDDNITRLQNLIAYHDAPVATISYFVHSLLSEQIARNGYRISVSGTAADELFTGYYDHFNLHFYEMRKHPYFETLLSDWQQHIAGYVRHPDFQNPKLYFDNPRKRDHIYLNNDVFKSTLRLPFNEAFTETHYADDLLRNRMMNELFHEVVRVILREDDLNSMLYSIENRSPFLDRNLFEWAYSMPTEHLIKNGYNKFILRESMKGILNDQVRLSREKKGFNASINSIFDFSKAAHRDFFLSDSPVFELFDREAITRIIGKGEFSNSYKKFLFNFINVKLFLETSA